MQVCFVIICFALKFFNIFQMVRFGDSIQCLIGSGKNYLPLFIQIFCKLCLRDIQSWNIAAVTRACRFFLYNIRRIRPFLNTYWTQLLVQAMVLSCLDYCNSLLAGLPASAIRPLQLIETTASRLVFNVPRHSHVTPLLTDLHWLPFIACIKFKTLVLAYQAVKGSAPAYIQNLIRPYTPARPPFHCLRTSGAAHEVHQTDQEQP